MKSFIVNNSLLIVHILLVCVMDMNTWFLAFEFVDLTSIVLFVRLDLPSSNL
jgi:hypothetical protein